MGGRLTVMPNEPKLTASSWRPVPRFGHLVTTTGVAHLSQRIRGPVIRVRRAWTLTECYRLITVRVRGIADGFVHAGRGCAHGGGGAVVTGWQVRQDPAALGLLAGEARTQADVAAFREATTRLLVDLVTPTRSLDVETAERIVSLRLREPEFATVLEAIPGGPDAAAERVLAEVRAFRPTALGAAGSLAAMVKVALLSQIDVLWWGHLPPYDSDDDVFAADDLLNLEALRRENRVLFRYRLQTSTLLARAARRAERQAMPDRAPRTAGLRFPLARAELVVVLNEIAAEFASLAPRGTPRLWVTSMARSIDYQRHLSSLGYSAPLPSAHCVGYAADVEMDWYRQFQADYMLQRVLLERQRAGDVNVIDEGQAWHICVRPGAGHALRLMPLQAVVG
jgi:hypothetical protein